MNSPQSFSDVERMIHHLETAIDAKSVTPDLLADMQQQLDTLDKKYKNDPAYDQQYHKLYELQALIYGKSSREADAHEFIEGALENAGGADKLYSKKVRKYVEEHPAEFASVQDANGETRFFAMSIKRFVVLSFLTFGFYHLYWFYRNWKLLKIDRQEKLMPFWRAIFSIIWAWPLFKEILTSAKAKGYTEQYSPGNLAFAYISLLILSEAAVSGENFSYVLSAISFVLFVGTVNILIRVQKAINYNNSKLTGWLAEPMKRTGGETAVIIVGIIVGLTGYFVLFTPPSVYEPYLEELESSQSIER